MTKRKKVQQPPSYPPRGDDAMRGVVHLINLINHRVAVCFVFYKTSSRWERLNGFSRFMHCVQIEDGPPLIPPRGDDAMREGDPLPLRGLFHYSFPLALPQGRGVLPLSGGRVHAGCCASDKSPRSGMLRNIAVR